MSIVSDKTGAVLDQALNLRFKRQQLLAANIANVDTPNYRPVDLAFEGALKDALNRDHSADPTPPGFNKTNAMHMSGWMEEAPEATEVVVREDVTNSLDNNGVDLDKEMARLVDNSTNYQTVLEVSRRRFNILTELISTMSQG
jgi:flagellar basal-body rod protein FlgB